jgi:protein gp37
MRRFGKRMNTLGRSKNFEVPLKWREGLRVFTCSMSDFFHPTADRWRPAAWDVIRRTPHHTYMILTKRPERIPRNGFIMPPNVWLGVTAENQAQANIRIPELLKVRAALHFVSVEPMLGPVSISAAGGFWVDLTGAPVSGGSVLGGIRWVICGGESGAVARPMDVAWVRELREECRKAQVPFFFKQWGDASTNPEADKEGGPFLDGEVWKGEP